MIETTEGTLFNKLCIVGVFLSSFSIPDNSWTNILESTKPKTQRYDIISNANFNTPFFAYYYMNYCNYIYYMEMYMF